MMEGIQTQNFTVETATGLIGTLQQQISDLEKKKLVAQSPDELATIHSQLETMQENLSYLQNITPEQAARMRNRGSEPKLAPITSAAIWSTRCRISSPSSASTSSRPARFSRPSGTGVSKKITFGARNKAKLSTAQLALVTDKGWTIG